MDESGIGDEEPRDYSPAPAITDSFPKKTRASPTVLTAVTRKALANMVLTASPAELQYPPPCTAAMMYVFLQCSDNSYKRARVGFSFTFYALMD